MNKISFKKDVLMGFIDEAAITVTDGKKYGRAFVGINSVDQSSFFHLQNNRSRMCFTRVRCFV